MIDTIHAIFSILIYSNGRADTSEISIVQFIDSLPSLSAQLFNIDGEHTIREALEYRTHDISIGWRRTSNLWYADDTILFALDEEEMGELVNLVKMTSQKFGLCIN